jgi:hypothetical protein
VTLLYDETMSRAQSSWLLVVLLGAVHTHTRAEDGPPPINTTRSVSAGADDDIITHGDEASSSVSGHATGTYMGVVPGSATPPPAARTVHSPATITWPGFQMRPDGSSRVFIQSNTPLDPQPTAAAGKYAVHLPGAHVSSGTNRLPLETRFFNTPVTKVSLTVDRSGATVVLDLRASVTPSISSERGANGYYFTYIDLPKGSYVSAPNKTGAPPEPEGTAEQQSASGKQTFAPQKQTKSLEGDVSGEADADNELPPGVKASSHTRAGIKLGN